MSQEWTENLLKENPLRDVTDEIEHGTPHLKHVDVNEKPEKSQEEGVVKSEVPDAFLAELKDDHAITEPVHNLSGTEAGFMAADPLHDLKQEIESGSPKLKHVETPDSPMGASQDADVVKSEVPAAFEEELKNDHDIVSGHRESPSKKGADVPTHETNVFHVPSVGLSARGVPVPSGRGTPTFRISAHHGMRPGGPLSRDLKSETGNEVVSTDESTPDTNPEDSSPSTNEVSSGTITSRGLTSRGTPAFRISAHHGMRPGGPLSRDLKSETSENTGGGEEGAGADLSGEIKPKGPGLHRGLARGSGPRRGGLARTGSGVPGEQKGGSSLARTGSGVPGNSLARTGSGVPSAKGGNDLKDFSSFLDS